MWFNLFFACAVCFGDPTSLITKGVQVGILFLLGVIAAVLFAIAALAFQWSRRARQFPDQF